MYLRESVVEFSGIVHPPPVLAMSEKVSWTLSNDLKPYISADLDCSTVTKKYSKTDPWKL